jgi:hypothetical protein
MKRRVLLLLPVFAVFLCPLCAQDPSQGEQRLPSGKSQKEEILKAEHQNSLRDAAELVKRAEELKADLEKNDYHILSLGAVKKTEEIEKLARRIKSRLRRF